MTDATYEKGLGGDLVGVWASVFARQRAFGEHAFEQLDDEGFFRVVAPGLNSVGVIARHMGGNMVSRWTDFLTADGEKGERDRDAELEPYSEAMSTNERAEARRGVMGEWERGWAALDGALGGLTESDAHRTVLIRGKPHSVAAAVARQLDHYAFHIGQINVIARQVVGTERWRWFTLAPGGTRAFNERMFGA